MSDNSAASLLGQPAEPAAAPAPAANQPASPSMPVQPAADTVAWDWSKYAKDEDLGWLQTKHYADVPALIKAARSSEQLIGHEKVALPKDANDVDGLKRVWSKLGWPDKPEDYGLELPEGADKSFVDRMVKKMHGNGVSKSAAQALVKDYLSFGSEQQQRVAQQQQAERTQQLDALKVEWGAATERQVQIAQRGIDAFAPEGMLEKLRDAIGPAATLKFFNRLGLELTEAKRIDGEGDAFGPMTPAQAKYAIQQKMLDRNFLEAYQDRNHPGHDAALAEMTRLHKFASPE